MNNFFIAALPEPINGQSTANKKIYEELSKKQSIRLIDTSPRISQKNFKYHANRIFSHAIALKNIFFSSKIDKIYTVYESGLGANYNKIIFFAAALKGGNIILHHHTSEHTVKKSEKFASLIKNKKILHVFLSRAMKEDFTLNYGENNSIILNNASLIAGSKNSPRKIKGTTITIGYISNITIEKGSKNILALIEELIKEGINFKFIVAGPILDTGSQDIIKKCQFICKEKFSYIGKVSGESKNNFFSSIDVLVFPSEYKYEAQPLVILEAISMGIPVFTSKIGYTWEIVPSEKFFCEKIDDFCSLVISNVKKYNENNSAYLLDSERSIEFFCNLLNESKTQLDDLVKILSCK